MICINVSVYLYIYIVLKGQKYEMISVQFPPPPPSEATLSPQRAGRCSLNLSTVFWSEQTDFPLSLPPQKTVWAHTSWCWDERLTWNDHYRTTGQWFCTTTEKTKNMDVLTAWGERGGSYTQKTFKKCNKSSPPFLCQIWSLLRVLELLYCECVFLRNISKPTSPA